LSDALDVSVGDVCNTPDVEVLGDTAAGDVSPAGAALFVLLPATISQTTTITTIRMITHITVFAVLDIMILIMLRPFTLPFHYITVKSAAQNKNAPLRQGVFRPVSLS
jgi:hypothetical protein